MLHGEGTFGRGPADGGAAGNRNDDRNVATSALPRRSDTIPYGSNGGADLNPVMVNFQEMGTGGDPPRPAIRAHAPPPAQHWHVRRPGRCARPWPPGRPRRSEPSCE